MKISSIATGWDAYNVSKIRPAQKTAQTDKKQDTFTISTTAKDFQTALKQLSSVPDVREERVNAVKSSLASGTYNVSAQEIVDKIFDSEFNTQA